jgi:hypothetical protein
MLDNQSSFQYITCRIGLPIEQYETLDTRIEPSISVFILQRGFGENEDVRVCARNLFFADSLGLHR